MMVAILFVAAFAAFVISAVSGGGAGLVLVPLLRLVVPIASVPAALSIGTAASSVSRIALFRRSIRYDVVCRFLPTALPAAAIGTWLLTRFQPVYVELILACFLLANLPALLRRRSVDTSVTARPLSRRRLPLIGVAAGLLSGFTGAVGLVFNGAYQRLGMTPHQIVATRAMNEVLLHLLKIALYIWFGLLDRNALAAGGVVALAAVLASVATRWLLPRMRETMFRTIGQVAMIVAGAAMFLVSSTQIAALHRAWIAVVSLGREKEVQVYWNGTRQLAAELEDEGHVALERTIAFDALPPAMQKAALAVVPRTAMYLVEEVRSPQGLSYEVYYVRNGRREKMELTPTPLMAVRR